MKIVNLTPHTVNLCREDGSIIRSYPSEGNVRAEQKEKTVDLIEIEDEVIEVVNMEYGEPVGLPNPEEGTLFIVSALTATAAKDNELDTNDLLITADPVRDGAGRIVGCRKFARV